jgi:hypothetical protein
MPLQEFETLYIGGAELAVIHEVSSGTTGPIKMTRNAQEYVI